MKNKNIVVDDDEIWKKIEGYGDKYMVSNMGKVRNFATGNLLQF